MRIGIFGGSFNPIHVGHAILASYISQSGLVDEVWFMVSPQNPMKSNKDIADFTHRFNMCKITADKCRLLKACDFEQNLEAPYYTVNTLEKLKTSYPEHTFKLIIGADNLQIFNKWKNHEKILKEFGIIVYPRIGYDNYNPELDSEHIEILNGAPIIDISSTQIRNYIMTGKDIRFYVNDDVLRYINCHKLYKDE